MPAQPTSPQVDPPQAADAACPWPVPARRIGAARVTPLESQFRHAIHCYHGVDAFDRAGGRLLYAGFDDPNDVAIVVRELDTGAEHVIARTRGANYHTAVSQRWALDDTAVLFDHRLEDGRRCPALVHLDRPGEIELLEPFVGRQVRHVIDHGHLATAYVAIDSLEHVPECAVELIDLQQRTATALLNVERALEVLPKDKADAQATFFFNHPVPNGDASMYFLKLMKLVDDGPQFVSFYIYDATRDDVRCFGDRISGHPYWMSDDRHILNIKHPCDGSNNRHLVLVDAMTGADHKLFDLPTEGPGHPSQSPGGALVVTDAFTVDGLSAPIYLFDLKHQQAVELARLDHRFTGGAPRRHEPAPLTRGQPHPVWSPCGTRVLVNCNQGGTEYRLHLLDGFWRDG